MIKVLNIIGARPQIIKAAAISRAIRSEYSAEIEEIILHTGQHYDHKMSDIFFSEMDIRIPKYNLGIGSGSHGQQTAQMISRIEEVIEKDNPDYVIIYGDTNSTLAGAIVASKLHIPLVHIESGMRSFNKSMPEEINRIMSDHVSTLLFCPTTTAINNLLKEGFQLNNTKPFTMDNPGVFHCGDIMYDNAIYYKEKAKQKINVFNCYGVNPNEYILVTLHRPINTDIPERLNNIFEALNEIIVTNNIAIVLPLHPRTEKFLEQSLNKSLLKAIRSNKLFKITKPASYFEIIELESNSKMVLTDSGGVQKEAFFYNKPVIILRAETEWTELVEIGAAKLADADKNLILDSFNHFKNYIMIENNNMFGDGYAANFICKVLTDNNR